MNIIRTFKNKTQIKKKEKKKEGVLNFPWYVVNLEDWLHDFKIEATELQISWVNNSIIQSCNLRSNTCYQT